MASLRCTTRFSQLPQFEAGDGRQRLNGKTSGCAVVPVLAAVVDVIPGAGRLGDGTGAGLFGMVSLWSFAGDCALEDLEALAHI